jgi:hypothetical protein
MEKIQLFFIKDGNLFIPRPPGRTYMLQEKTLALNREHPALLNMKYQFL